MSNIRRSGCPGVVALGLLLSFAACTTWKVQELSPQQVLADQKPRQIRVTRSDSTRVEVVRPQVVGDSLVGTVTRKRFSMPVSDVRAVAVHKTNVGATIGVLLGLAAAGFGAYLVILASAMAES